MWGERTASDGRPGTDEWGGAATMWSRRPGRGRTRCASAVSKRPRSAHGVRERHERGTCERQGCGGWLGRGRHDVEPTPGEGPHEVRFSRIEAPEVGPAVAHPRPSGTLVPARIGPGGDAGRSPVTLPSPTRHTASAGLMSWVTSLAARAHAVSPARTPCASPARHRTTSSTPADHIDATW